MITLLLLLFPLFSAFLCLIFPEQYTKSIAFISGSISFGIIAFTWSNASFLSDRIPLDQVWVESLGIHFKMGLDGISLLMVFLTNLLIPIIIASSLKTEYPKPKLFYFLILFMQAGLIGVFTALDGFLFYVSWEAALIPIYFIAGLWGGVHRAKTTLKFFIYTITGSLFMLMGIIYLYLQTPDKTFDIQAFYSLNLSPIAQNFVFISFFLAFAIKMPIFPFHTWQPDTYSEAPTQGTMLLGGIMLKMGLYGVIRWLLPISPHAFLIFAPYIIVLSIIGIVYASIIAFTQQDLKRLLAYSSIAHVGLISAALFVNNFLGLQGGLIQMLSHGINLVGLFFIVSLIQKQAGTRDIDHLGGIASKAPILATCFLIILLGSVALPLTNGFVGEFLMLNGLFNYNVALSIVAGLTLIFGAVYMFRMYQKTMLGNSGAHTMNFKDIEGTDRYVLFMIVFLVIIIGIYPNPIFRLTEPAVAKIILEINSKLIIN